MKKKILIILLSFFVLGFILRVLYLPQKALTFGYDQARDAFVSQQILKGDLKILGPSASTPGLYHGVFYYYLLAPSYLIGQGNPIVATIWIVLLNVLGIFVVYFLTYKLTKKTLVSLLAALLYTISFESVQYALWLSNPSTAIWSVPLIYLGLWVWLKEKKNWGAIVCAVALGLSIQAEIFLAYHLVPVILWLVLLRKEINKKSLILFAGSLVVALSTMILVEVKFGFKSLSGMANLFLGQDLNIGARSFGDYLVLYLNQFGKIFRNAIFPTNEGYAGALGLIATIVIMLEYFKSKKKEILSWQLFTLTYLLSHLTVVSVGGVSTPTLTIGLLVPAIIFVSYLLIAIYEKKKIWAILILAVILLANLSKVVMENSKGQNLFAVQKDFILSDELKVVDYTYQEAKDRPFSINTITNPLWVNTTWSYLYNWYGLNKYGRLPEWHGRDQVGQLGNNLNPTSDQTKLFFLIVEPQEGIPDVWIAREKSDEDSKSRLIEDKSFGRIHVQKRERLTI